MRLTYSFGMAALDICLHASFGECFPEINEGIVTKKVSQEYYLYV